MLSLDKLKMLLKLLPIPQESKDKITSSSLAIESFRNFLATKYSLSEKDADNKIKSYIESNIKKGASIDDVAQVSYDYSINEGYDKSDELKSAIIDLTLLIEGFKDMVPTNK